MQFDIVEAIRQKQQKQPQIVRIEDDEPLDITTENGSIVIRIPAED